MRQRLNQVLFQITSSLSLSVLYFSDLGIKCVIWRFLWLLMLCNVFYQTKPKKDAATEQPATWCHGILILQARGSCRSPCVFTFTVCGPRSKTRCPSRWPSRIWKDHWSGLARPRIEAEVEQCDNVEISGAIERDRASLAIAIDLFRASAGQYLYRFVRMARPLEFEFTSRWAKTSHGFQRGINFVKRVCARRRQSRYWQRERRANTRWKGIHVCARWRENVVGYIRAAPIVF